MNKSKIKNIEWNSLYLFFYNTVQTLCCNFQSSISDILYLMFILVQSLSFLNPKNIGESVSLVSRLSDYVISNIVAVMVLTETFTFT